MTTSRFARAASRTRTITGTTSVGGSSSTTVALYPDNTIRFNDRNGTTQVVQVPANYTTGFQNQRQPSSGKVPGSPSDALFALIDALIARA